MILATSLGKEGLKSNRPSTDFRVRGEESRAESLRFNFYPSSRVDYESESVLIGIGGSLATPFLSHHRGYGSVPRRFGQVKQYRERLSWGNRAIGSKRWVTLVGRPRDATYATRQTKPLPQQQREHGGRL